jgi:PBP1b-binding outer membrane lipoprotein LpoB
MKKLTIIISILLLIFTGCSQQAVDIPASTVIENSGKNAEASSLNTDYVTTKETLEVTSKNSKIYYPKLQGYKGELSMDYMNQSIKQIADFYAKAAEYTDVQLDYEVKRLDEKIVSILFKGTAKLNDSQDVNIQKSINLDVKSTNPIEYGNFIENDKKVRQLLDEKAKGVGITGGFEAEGIFIYFEGDHVVFYYMPLDDSAKAWVELSVPLIELEGLINTEFGEHPAS